MNGPRLYYASYDSPVGLIRVAASVKGLFSLEFELVESIFLSRLAASGKKLEKDHARFVELFRTFDGYFSGKRVDFDFSVDIPGSPFELRVWNALKEIPYGETKTYGHVARAAGSPRGARAVGGACGRNPLPIVIPCHRVIVSGGRIGGYSCGVSIKKALLELEGITLSS